jgi:hypothetical protein
MVAKIHGKQDNSKSRVNVFETCPDLCVGRDLVFHLIWFSSALLRPLSIPSLCACFDTLAKAFWYGSLQGQNS